MTIDGKVSTDISCLYAAKGFSQYLTISLPEAPKGAAAMEKIYKILDTKSDEILGKFFTDVENNPGDDDEESLQSEFTKVVSGAYQTIKSEVESTYKNLSSLGSLSDGERQIFMEFLAGFKEDDVPMILYGRREKYDPVDPVTLNILEHRKKDEAAYTKYLASADMDTPEGRAAWQIAHFSGLHFSNVTRGDKEESIIKVSPTDFEKEIESAVADGLLCASETALIEDTEELKNKARQWLSTEIDSRLSQGLEFNLLDSVSVRKGEDGLIYLRDDEREPYTVE